MMLNGISIYATNKVWRKILIDLGATLVDDSKLADLNFDSLEVPDNLTPIELQSIILNTIDNNQREIIKKIFKKSEVLPSLQKSIVVLLYKTGGISASDLKSVMGYSPDMATHTIDTAIYQLRKTYGKDFIKNENGKYFIG
ncbi:MAG TPA: hypothetical protein PLZ05_00455 [Alphaproteobacteria bacterium]|nr:hypothetical protein [Alphaproteobacteria bacterium]